MFKMNKTIHLYKYEKLSETAKEQAKKDYLEARDGDFFEENCNDKLYDLFPNSELSVEYSLRYCQGDGLNIYGKLYLDDVLAYIKDKFSEKGLKTLKWIFSNYNTEYTMKRNDRYAYCMCDKHEYMEDIEDNLKCDYIRNIPYELIGKFNRVVQLYMKHLCDDFEADGYEYFYEVSEETMQEDSEINGYLYYSNGELAEYSMNDIEKENHDKSDNVTYIFADWFTAGVDSWLLKA